MFRNLRRGYQVFFLALFLYLVFVAAGRWLGGHPVHLFLALDPLVALTTALASHSLAPHLLWAVPLAVLTLVFGRFFCGWICPMGVLHHLISRLTRRRKTLDNIALNQPRPRAQAVKYGVLAVMLGLSALGSVQVGLLDPIASTWRGLSTAVLPAASNAAGGAYQGERHFQYGTLITVVFFTALALNLVWPRFYCRVLCPLGALLGLLSKVSLFRIARRGDACTNCKLCTAECSGAADPMGTCKTAECMLCLNCIESCAQGAISYSFLPDPASHTTAVDLPRRRAVAAVAAGALAVPLMRASDGVGPRPNPERIRPPGAVEEEEFLARCIKCAACMKVCPTGGLQPALTQAGVEGLWTPVLLPRIGHCEQSCVQCSQVCPTAAIAPLQVEHRYGLPPATEPVRIGSAQIDRGRCLPWANDTDCIVCEEVCPTSPKAIFFKEEAVHRRDGATVTLKRPHVDLEKCIGCGVCEARCPVFDRAAIRVSSVGETRSDKNRIVLKGGGKV